MSKKSYVELKQEITQAAEKSTVFSSEKFEELALAFANERDTEFGYARYKDGELTIEKAKPAEFFTKLVYDILVSNGHDKQEAEAIAAKYEFKSFKGAYLAFSEILFGYIETGKSFKFASKEDFAGSIYLRDHEESIKEHRNPQDPEGTKIKVKKKKHRTLESKSTAPDWLKARI